MCYNVLVMKTYLLELTAIANDIAITTRISDTDTGCYMEESWVKEGNVWILKENWTNKDMSLGQGLYETLFCCDKRTDEMINEVIKIGSMEFVL